MKVTKQYRTETAHRLLNHPSLCKYIHGHSYLWEITVEGIANPDGMVIDFKNLKQNIEQILKPFDHAIVLHKADPIIEQMKHITERLIVFPSNPTAENFASYVAITLINSFKLDVSKVRCWETVNSYADWNVHNA